MYKLYFKQITDSILAVLLTIFTFPLIVILCAMICLDSPGFPIFRHQRVGKKKKPFYIFKLRTMKKDASGSFQTKENDDRITRSGKSLRRASLDELPQIWNIALGHMSFIGPRPSSHFEEERYSDEEWNKRHSIKPGITGLAHSTKRSSATIKERMDFDLEYIEKCSFLLDIKILWKTIQMVLLAKNVN